MGKLFNDISDQRVLFFTEAMAQLGQRSATFKTEDQMITPANEKQILREAAEQAKRFAAARNRGGASPKAYRPDEEPVVNGVMAWLQRRKLRGHGKREK